MTAAPRHAVLYGRDADAYLVARAVDTALAGDGCHVSVEQADDEDEVWISRRNGPVTEAVRFLPGQRLVVTYGEGWRIEPAAETAVTP